MAAGKTVRLLFIFLTLTCVFSHSWTPQNEGNYKKNWYYLYYTFIFKTFNNIIVKHLVIFSNFLSSEYFLTFYYSKKLLI